MNAAETTVTSMSNLFTPSILFCVLNLMIGTIFISSRLKFHKKQEMVDSPPGQLVRVPSFLDRVKSFNFSSYRSEQPDPFHSVTQLADPHEEQEQMVEERVLESHQMIMRSKSETSLELPAKGGPAMRMEKSASEKPLVEEQEEEVDERRSAKVRERKGSRSEMTSFAEDEAVDKKADEFINRFRQQLKLQRLDSLLRYKEMLNKRVGR